MGRKLTQEDVLTRIIEVHGDKYDLSKVKYINRRTKVTLICSTHGEFSTTTEQLFRGQGCYTCGKKQSSDNRRTRFQDFVQNAKEIHGEKYNYYPEAFKKSSVLTTINCIKHGDFKQRPSDHLNQKQGCPICGRTSQIDKRKLSNEEFILKAKLVHNKKYTYPNIHYTNSNSKIDIFCPKHGIFNTNAGNHLMGSGCPKCNESKGEVKIRKILEDLKIPFIQQKTFEGLKDIGLLKCDFYLPQSNSIIEFNGRQHYEPVAPWGGIKNLNEIKRRDQLKRDFCKKHSINLLEIHFQEKQVERIIKAFLKL